MILKNFIVFEGIDGAGTTTQLKRLKTHLSNQCVFFTAEPSKSEIGKFIRTVLKGDTKLCPETIAYLFATDRCEHLYAKVVSEQKTKIANTDCGIIERCNKGQICVSDRYLFSSLAYQSLECGDQLPRKLNGGFPLPQIVFYFMIAPSVSLNRIKGRNVTEIYEKLDFLEKTAEQYEKVFKEYEKKHPEMIIIRIDATQDPDKIEKIIWSKVSKLPI